MVRAFDSISACIAAMKRWGALNGMNYNNSKTEFTMVYSMYGPEPARNRLTVGVAKIQPLSSLRSLGMILDSHLTMDAEIRSS